MREVTHEIWNMVEKELDQVSDGIGEEQLADGYLLKYEGWGGMCVEVIWSRVLDEQKKKGIETESEEAICEREDACYKYAEEQTLRIIEEEWISQLQERGFKYIDGGYDQGGIYGRTWALFRRTEEEVIR